MKQELKEIREELLIAIENKDLIYAKMIINRIDSLIYKLEKVKDDRELLIAYHESQIPKFISESHSIYIKKCVDDYLSNEKYEK